MRFRRAALLATVTLLALGSPTAMAGNGNRGGKPKVKKGSGAGHEEVRPVRPTRRGEAPTLSQTRGRRALPGESLRAPIAARGTQRRTATSTEQPAQEVYPTRLHAARAAQRRPGRLRRTLLTVGLVAAVGVGLFVVGDALGLDNAIGGLFDNFGGGGVEPQSPWENMPDPPSDWPGGGGEAPAPGEWPDWAPEKPGGGGGGPPSFEQVQEQLDKLMGREPPAPTK